MGGGGGGGRKRKREDRVRGTGNKKNSLFLRPLSIFNNKKYKNQGDTREAVELAAKKVAPMLDPENDWFHDTKDKQLRELAIINGTLKEGDGDACFLCGSSGHRQFECPSRGSIVPGAAGGGGGDAFKLPTAIQASVEAQYARDVARMQGGSGRDGADAGKKADDEYKSFLEELGGGGGSGDGGGEGLPPRPNFGAPPPSSSRLHSSRRNMLREPYGSTGGGGGGGPPSAADGAPNECKLFLGNLDPSVDDEILRDALETALGLPHGPVGAETLLEVRVVPDDGRNLGELPAGAPAPKNRGFAFAVMATPEAAADACRRANGFLVGEAKRPLKVQPRGGGPPPPGVPPGGFPLPGVFDVGGPGGGLGRKDEDEEGRKLFITVRERERERDLGEGVFFRFFFSSSTHSLFPTHSNLSNNTRASTSRRPSPRLKPSASSTPPPGSA